MKKKIDFFEVLVIVFSLLFTVAISLYHISFDGYLGLSAKYWDVIWSISENGLLLVLSHTIMLLSYGIIKYTFKYILRPYFALKLLYHFSCYSGIYFWSAQIWEYVWSCVLVLQLILGMLYCIIKIRRDKYVA